LGEVIQSLINANLQLESLEEFDYSPYDCFKNTVEFEPGKYRIKHLADRIPMVYALVARKRELGP
ncbi:MAG: SAM-dependent methyltransferase, partial [Bacteroidota bacterium]